VASTTNQLPTTQPTSFLPIPQRFKPKPGEWSTKRAALWRICTALGNLESTSTLTERSYIPQKGGPVSLAHLGCISRFNFLLFYKSISASERWIVCIREEERSNFKNPSEGQNWSIAPLPLPIAVVLLFFSFSRPCQSHRRADIPKARSLLVSSRTPTKNVLDCCDVHLPIPIPRFRRV